MLNYERNYIEVAIDHIEQVSLVVLMSHVPNCKLKNKYLVSHLSPQMAYADPHRTYISNFSKIEQFVAELLRFKILNYRHSQGPQDIMQLLSCSVCGLDILL